MSAQGEQRLVTSHPGKPFLLHYFFAAVATHPLLGKPSFLPSSLPLALAQSSFWTPDLTPPGLVAHIPRAPSGGWCRVCMIGMPVKAIHHWVSGAVLLFLSPGSFLYIPVTLPMCLCSWVSLPAATANL